ncbi:unnamed protein product [Polarella glacialis]|uniref:Receptor protein serine/threonine kinase n=1 Tax=Polarella glacialis TaxID=89957 RepID=A0A813HPK9_POLGL|nr:unnamed protein product [Polarella glacialis]
MRVGKLLVAILLASHLVNFSLGQVTSFCNPKPLKCTETTTTLDRNSNPFDGVNVGWGAKPVAVDWDGDGDIDLLVGNSDGRIQFFERTADAALVERTGSSNPVDGIDVGSFAAPFAVDWDEDGDIDLIVSDVYRHIFFFERNADASLIERTGSSNPFDGIDVGGNAAPCAVDWDGDGDIDLLASNSDGRIQFFERSANASLIERTGSSNPFDGIDVGWNAAPCAVDWDEDGDIDLLVGNQDGRIFFFERTADAKLIGRTGSSNPFDGINAGDNASPFAVDWDGDGDIDLLASSNSDGRIQFLERSADAWLTYQTGNFNPFVGIDVGWGAQPCAVDWDGDGDIDLLVGNVDGRVQFFERTADASLVERPGSSNPFVSIDVGRSAHPFAVDWDGDGDIDLLVGKNGLHPMTDLASNPDGRIQFFERTANASLIERTGSSNPFDGIVVGWNAAPCVVDWDEDGDIDLLVGSQDGRIYFFERTANASLIERTGSSNPFDGIDVGFDATQFAADWDGDGDIDLLVGNSVGRVQFFSSSFSCEVLDPCSRNGICAAAAGGACVCLVGYDNADCSGCSGGYYSEDLSCVPCPGLSSAEGTCSGRGQCLDDNEARRQAEAQHAPNASIAMAHGNGTCACSFGFSGSRCDEGQQLALLCLALLWSLALVQSQSCEDLWGPEGSVSVYVVDAGGLSVADPSVESCSEGAFQSSDMQHIMTIGIVEHWFIKPSDITPGPKSILGSGSFGIVVKGMLNYATEVAIKIPKTRFQSREESQLANEMRLFRHIRHSNIVLFHGATLMVINGGSPCLSLVLEWVNGGNFGEYMQQLRSTAGFEADGHAFAYKILLDVARGMTYLHKLTPVILHLDLKPANILVEKSVPPKGKITDFGLSRFARNSLPQPKVGTEKYMAPEVAQRKPYGPAADVFSFGRVIIWTITGELCPELIPSTSFKGQEDACLFQTLDEVASSCLEEVAKLRLQVSTESLFGADAASVKAQKCPCLDRNCKDEGSFVDEKGYFCDAWIGDGCSKAATEKWSYSQSGHAHAKVQAELRTVRVEGRACKSKVSGVGIDDRALYCPGKAGTYAPKCGEATDSPTPSSGCPWGAVIHDTQEVQTQHQNSEKTLVLEYKYLKDRQALIDSNDDPRAVAFLWEAAIDNRRVVLPCQDGAVFVVSDSCWNSTAKGPSFRKLSSRGALPSFRKLPSTEVVASAAVPLPLLDLSGLRPAPLDLSGLGSRSLPLGSRTSSSFTPRGSSCTSCGFTPRGTPCSSFILSPRIKERKFSIEEEFHELDWTYRSAAEAAPAAEELEVLRHENQLLKNRLFECMSLELGDTRLNDIDSDSDTSSEGLQVAAAG